MQPREFLRRLPGAVQAKLPADLAGCSSGFGFSLVQLWYGNRALHYEAWLRHRQDVIEIGLHFEADPLTNMRLLAAFRARERVVRKGLGDGTHIEEWDRGWTRLWEPVSLAHRGVGPRLDAPVGAGVAGDARRGAPRASCVAPRPLHHDVRAAAPRGAARGRALGAQTAAGTFPNASR